MEQFHGEFTSSDASGLTEANSRFTLYSAPTKSVLSVGASDRVVITDYEFLTGASGLTVQLYDGANTTIAGGERIAQGTFAANGGTARGLHVPHTCLMGTYPKIKTSGSGQIDSIIRGYILRG